MTGTGKTIAFFPEASYGAALNCVGIAQQIQQRGGRPVFICQPAFRGVFADYGFSEYSLAATPGEPEIDWTDFINRHKDVFRQTPEAQIDSYVVPTWEAIVGTAMAAEERLGQLLGQIKPSAIVLDNVVMFPAIVKAGVPWVRVVSCAETELSDEEVPPYLSGLGNASRSLWKRFTKHYLKAIAPVHRQMNAFLAECGLAPYRAGEFLETSPYLNLLLSPSIVRHRRKTPLDPERFVYLDGCLRKEVPYILPSFARQSDRPLVLTSFGSLGAMDVAMIKRMISVFANLPFRFIVNVGPWRDDYSQVPDNVFLESWFPQPSVVAQSSLFINHGGNNSFCEALYFGVPSLVMPFCWDGHDNAVRAAETGVGAAIHRYDWSDADLSSAIVRLIEDRSMAERLTANAKSMQAAAGASAAADAILKLLP